MVVDISFLDDCGIFFLDDCMIDKVGILGFTLSITDSAPSYQVVPSLLYIVFFLINHFILWCFNLLTTACYVYLEIYVFF